MEITVNHVGRRKIIISAVKVYIFRISSPYMYIEIRVKLNKRDRWKTRDGIRWHGKVRPTDVAAPFIDVC